MPIVKTKKNRSLGQVLKLISQIKALKMMVINGFWKLKKKCGANILDKKGQK